MVRLILPVFFGCLVAAVSALAQGPPQSYNTTLFGTLNPEPPNGGERYSALTGWAAPNGREYALLGGYSGTYIVDVTTAPVKQVAFIPGPHNGWREMKTVGHYGYVVSEGGAGLQIIELAGLPATATLVKNDTTFFRSAHTISAQGKYLYVSGTGASAGANGGVIILDITNPTVPTKVGTWADRYSHDCTIRNDTMYVAAINNGELDIVALGTDRTAPHTVATITYPGAGTHNCDLTPDGSYICSTDEINSTPKTLKVWDRRDIGSIAKVADYTPVPNEIIHNLHFKGSTAYVAWYSAGTRIIDMTVPTEPAEIGYFDTFPGAVMDYVGNWETYPYLPSGKILASDMQSGLFVFTFNGAKRGSVHGVVRDSSTGDPIAGASIAIDRFGRVITSDAQGRYSYAGAVDSLDFTASATNYRNAVGRLILSEAGTTRDILLPVLPLASFSIRAANAADDTPIQNFSYRMLERPTVDGRAANNPEAFKVPVDSSYHIYVGAWGYRPKLITVTNPSGVLNVRLDAAYTDDAELELGWSLSQPSDNARGGRWERGVPVPTFYIDSTRVQPGEDNTADPFDHAFITGIANSAGGPGANDVDDGVTTLTSPPMDLRGYGNPILTCAIWYSRDARTDVVNDTLEVLISPDGGANWRTIDRITESPQSWMPRRYRLKNFYTSYGAQTLFRVVASDLNPQSLLEAGLDDFAVVDSGRPGAGVDDYDASRFAHGARVMPNPFTGTATLHLTLTAAQSAAGVELYDALGNRVRTLATGALPAGEVRLAIDGAGLAAGRYYWHLRLDDGTTHSGPVIVR